MTASAGGYRVSGGVSGAERALRAVFDDRDGPLPLLLLGLTMLAGVVDATSFLRLGHVFVATMTGNLLFIGLGAAGAKGFAVGLCAMSLGGFMIGAVIGGREVRAAHSHRGIAFRNVLATKAVFATAVTISALVAGPHLPIGVRDEVVVLLALSMGTQLALIRYLKVPDLLTVVLTLTLTGAITEWNRGLWDPAMLRRGLAVLAFVVGGALGALLIINVGAGAALALGLAIIIAVGAGAHFVSRSDAGWTAPH